MRCLCSFASRRLIFPISNVLQIIHDLRRCRALLARSSVLAIFRRVAIKGGGEEVPVTRFATKGRLDVKVCLGINQSSYCFVMDGSRGVLIGSFKYCGVCGALQPKCLSLYQFDRAFHRPAQCVHGFPIMGHHIVRWIQDVCRRC
jgi:hypothetical protein